MKINKPIYYFEPIEPILTKEEFTNELISFCNRENKDLIILTECMEPIVIIDDIKYICMLEQPKMINIPIIPIFITKTFGYKWVYIYKYDN